MIDMCAANAGHATAINDVGESPFGNEGAGLLQEVEVTSDGFRYLAERWTFVFAAALFGRTAKAGLRGQSGSDHRGADDSRPDIGFGRGGGGGDAHDDGGQSRRQRSRSNPA